jgi:hypothetical protein
MLTEIYDFLSENFAPLGTICPVAASETADYPVILYQLVNDRPTHTLDGTVPTTTSEIRIEIMSLDHAQTDSIATTISAGLDGYRGTMGDIFVIVKRLDGGDSAVVYDPSADAWVYTRQQDYQVRWCEVPQQGRTFSKAFSSAFGNNPVRVSVAPVVVNVRNKTNEDAAWEKFQVDYAALKRQRPA